MTVPPGFHVELVAAEPDIVNPVAMTFDERGRIWITEIDRVSAPLRRAGQGSRQAPRKHQGRRQVRQDHHRHRGPQHPLRHRGRPRRRLGRQLARHPLLSVRGLRRRAQARQAASRRHRLRPLRHARVAQLADLGPRRLALRPQRRLQSQRSSSRTARTFNFTCAMFRIHPRTKEFEIFCEGTSNPWGIAFDDERRRLRLAPASSIISGTSSRPATTIARAAPIRRSPGRSAPSSSTSTSKAAYCGLHWFDSDAYPPEYREKLYMGNIHGNCINCDELTRDGSTYFAKPRPDFLNANDAWFMPVVQKVGPGRLHVRPRLVRPLSLLPGRQPRPGGHRSAARPAVSGQLQGDAVGEGVRFDEGDGRQADRAAWKSECLTSATGPTTLD